MRKWTVALVGATIALGCEVWVVTSSVALADLAVRQALGLREGTQHTCASEWSSSVRANWGYLTIGGWFGTVAAMGTCYVVCSRKEAAKWGMLALTFSILSSLLLASGMLGWACAVSNVVSYTIPIHALP